MEDRNSNRLSFIENVALDGEIALGMVTSPHNDEMLYRIYLLCKETTPELRHYIIDAVRKVVLLPEEDLARVLLEVDSAEPPLWLWLNRTISDLKMFLRPNELTFSECDSLKVDKMQARRNWITSSFMRFVKEVALCCSPAAKALCERVQATQELDFLHLACYYLITEIEELEIIRPPKQKIPATILDATFTLKKQLSFLVEKRELDRLNSAESKPVDLSDEVFKIVENSTKKEEFGENLQSEITKAHKALHKLAEAVKTAAQEISETSDDMVYVVSKSYKTADDKGISTPLRTFKSEKEAVAYVKTLKENFPELERTCKFTISVKQRKRDK